MRDAIPRTYMSMRQTQSGLEHLQAGPPYELDPTTLGTKTNKPELLDDFLIDGIAPSSTGSRLLDRILRLGSAFTAHPHIVPEADGGDKRFVTWSWRRYAPGLLCPFQSLMQ